MDLGYGFRGDGGDGMDLGYGFMGERWDARRFNNVLVFTEF